MSPITKIEARTIIIIIIPATDELDTISTTTAMETISITPRTTSRISKLMYK